MWPTYSVANRWITWTPLVAGSAVGRSRRRRLSRHLSVVRRAAGAPRRHHQLTADGPGLVRGEEDGQVGDLRRVHHAADGIAPGRVGGKVLSLDLLRGDSQLVGPGGQQTRRTLGPRRSRMDAVDGDPEPP